MTTYGATTIPVAVPTSPKTEAVGDPSLDVWAAYFKAYINTYGGAAWARVFPFKIPNGTTQIPPILMTFTHQPIDETIAEFNENWLPALFVYRSSGGEQKWEWLDGRIARDVITLLWVFPTGVQAADRIRVPYVNALVKLIDAAIEIQRDPCYAHPSDTDPTAASIAADPNAIKLQIATSTSLQTYTGAALNGVIGNATFVQPRAFTITCTTAAAFVNGSTVTVTGLNVLGLSITRTITILTASIPGTFATDYAFTKITSIVVAAQASLLGLIEFGLAAYVGRGSLVLDFAPMGLKRSGNWTAKPIAIAITANGAMTSTMRYYDAVEIPLEAMEEWDRTNFATLNGMNGAVIANEAFEQELVVSP